MRGDWYIYGLASGVVLALWAGSAFFSPAARLERRRRKSHGRIVAKSKRPRVRFSVRLPKR
jgi:hypothetical protein